MKTSTLAGKYAFWVHNYIGDLDSTKHPDDAIKARLNFNIFGNGNTFTSTSKPATPVFYGFNNYVYFDVNGNQVEVN